MLNRTCEVEVVCPNEVVCACTSAEGYKRRRLGEELLSSRQDEILITTANTTVPETVFNQLRRPDRIAALKVAQQIPDNLKAFVIGVMSAEYGRVLPQIGFDVIWDWAQRIYDEMVSRNIPFTLTATDVVLHVDHPGLKTIGNINQPGNVSDEELEAILRAQVGDSDSPCIRDGLVPATFTVGMAACEMSLTTTKEMVGQMGQVEIDFWFSPVTDKEISDYVKTHGERARRVNGGVMWEHWLDHIWVINSVGREDGCFEDEMRRFRAMTSGVPMEMSRFLYDLSRRNHLKTPGCSRQTTSEVGELVETFLGRKLPEAVKWHSWYPDY